ncbi:unnamed protein product [Ranitomeya imitator]|uniref:Uncharacterized protein n=1 Tax=Ranitomeya imitator TaxID=111125 RepID=A0ABN9L2F9_9NEOB|nr:unnamed protein product [Ranitomeya imitator]
MKTRRGRHRNKMGGAGPDRDTHRTGPQWDRPAIPVESAKQNPNVALVLTAYGGHIGFLEGIWPRQQTYMDRIFKQFVQAVFEHGSELPSM